MKKEKQKGEVYILEEINKRNTFEYEEADIIMGSEKKRDGGDIFC